MTNPERIPYKVNDEEHIIKVYYIVSERKVRSDIILNV